MIPRDTIDRIFSAAHIEDVVGQYVSLKKRGANLIGLCPFHSEKTGSFTVSPSKGIYKCFGCGKAGNVVNFVMEIEQCGYPEALKLLAKRYHIEVEDRELTVEEQQRQDNRESMFVVNEFAQKWFVEQLWETAEGKAIGLSYFRERGLQDETIRRFGLGYSPAKGNPLTEALQKKGFAERFIVSDAETGIGTGLVGKSEDGRLYDRFRDRVIFPIHTISGKTVAFAGRILKKKENTGKYVNSPDSIIYSKTRELYGMFLAKQAIKRADRCYLVEGQMDVISLYQSGIQNVVSSGGTALTKEQIRLIHRFTDNITIIYDSDAAGIHAALRGIDMVLEEGMNVQVLLLPDGKDPDEFARSMDASLVVEYIKTHSTDFIHYKADLLLREAGEDPIRRSQALTDILHSIALEPELVKRSEHIRLLSVLSGNDEEDLQRVMTRQRKTYIDEKIKRREGANAEEGNTVAAQTASENTPANDPAPPVQADTALMYSAQDKRLQQRYGQLDTHFRNLIQVLLRDGQRVLFTTEEGQAVSAGGYILSQLAQDGIEVSNEVYSRIMKEYETQMQDAGFTPERYFSFHQDPAINQLAISLLSDPYPLSRMFSKQYVSENVEAEVKKEDPNELVNYIIQILLELKFDLINLRIDEVQQMLSGGTLDGASQETLLRQQMEYMQIRGQISQALGNRITAI
ncbi:MAG: DNA primase [Paludibacteraceae bacterium]|nr:DNA primase [Paludibacteraceae bacterium]